MCRNSRSSKSCPLLEKSVPIGRHPGPLERRLPEGAGSLDMSKIGRNCTIVIGARMLGHLGFSSSGRCIRSPVLKLVLTAPNELRSLLSVPALGQSNGCTEMRTAHRTRSPLMRRPVSNEEV